jgi:triacylglycerol lipase
LETLTYSVQTAILWGEMVKSAYSTYDADTHDTNPLTPQNLPDGWQVIANLQSDPVAGLFSEIQFIGFVVGSKEDSSQIGIVFRGTDGILDWVVDFEAKHVDFTDIPNGGRTEDGFTCMFRSLRVVKPGQTEKQTLDQFFRTLDSSTTITVTGHSLGGALANLTGAWIAASYAEFPLELYTFAAPMTGDKTFVATFNSLVSNNFRIYNEPDIVPKVPSKWLGYEQVDGGIELNSLNFPNLPHSIGGYHSLNTYLYMLEQ